MVAVLARWWRKAAVLLLLTAPLGAAAQWACYPSQVTVRGLTMPVMGGGTRGFIDEQPACKSYGWWCPMHYTPPQIVHVTGPASAFPQNWLSLAADLLDAPIEARVAAYKQYTGAPFPIVDGKKIVPPDLFPCDIAVWNKLQTVKPPDPIWKVAPNPGYTTRAAFAYSGGIRATTATARATVDATCYCDTRDVVGSTVYCAVNAARTWMSVCTRRN